MKSKLNLVLAGAVGSAALAQPSPPAKSARVHKDMSALATNDVSPRRATSATKPAEPLAPDRSFGNLREADDLAKGRKAPPPSFESIEVKPRPPGNAPHVHRQKEWSQPWAARRGIARADHRR